MKKLTTLLVIFAFMLITAACSNPALTTSQDDSDTSLEKKNRGTLMLVLKKNDSMKSILPDISMDIISFNITGTGPAGAAFEETGYTGSTLNQTLDPGEWTITVKAENAGRTIIYEGQTPVTIAIGETTVADVTIRPLEGYGSLGLTVDWKDNTLLNPQVVSTLTPAQGSIKYLNFSINGNMAVSTTDSIEAGYHTLNLKLFNNGLLAAGAVEIIRIVKDQTTDGTIIFTNLNNHTGAIDLRIIQHLENPLDVSLSGQVEKLAKDQEMTLTASVQQDAGNVTYVWYINGEAKATGGRDTPSYTVKDLSEGFYRLDVTAFTADGKRAGSSSWDFEVSDNNMGTLLLSLVPQIYAGGVTSNMDMNIHSYDITGSGPGGASFEETAYVENSLDLLILDGEWTISAQARNAEGLLLCEGETHVNILPGQTTEAQLPLMLIPGQGYLHLNIRLFEEGAGYSNQNYVIMAKMIPVQGDPLCIYPNPGPDDDYDISAIAESGIHTLEIEVLDRMLDRNSGEIIGGYMVTVQIVKDQTTKLYLDIAVPPYSPYNPPY